MFERVSLLQSVYVAEDKKIKREIRWEILSSKSKVIKIQAKKNMYRIRNDKFSVRLTVICNQTKKKTTKVFKGHAFILLTAIFMFISHCSKRFWDLYPYLWKKLNWNLLVYFWTRIASADQKQYFTGLYGYNDNICKSVNRIIILYKISRLEDPFQLYWEKNTFLVLPVYQQY